jgi:hypothetical protein
MRRLFPDSIPKRDRRPGEGALSIPPFVPGPSPCPGVDVAAHRGLRRRNVFGAALRERGRRRCGGRELGGKGAMKARCRTFRDPSDRFRPPLHLLALARMGVRNADGRGPAAYDGAIGNHSVASIVRSLWIPSSSTRPARRTNRARPASAGTCTTKRGILVVALRREADAGSPVHLDEELALLESGRERPRDGDRLAGGDRPGRDVEKAGVGGPGERKGGEEREGEESHGSLESMTAGRARQRRDRTVGGPSVLVEGAAHVDDEMDGAGGHSARAARRPAPSRPRIALLARVRPTAKGI